MTPPRNEVPIIEAPPCPNGPCESCCDPCPTYQGMENGIREGYYQVRPGYRRFFAVVNNIIIDQVDIQMGADATEVICRLSKALAVAQARKPRLTLVN